MKKFTLLSFMLVGLMALAGCDQGPAEEFGESVDDAASNVQDTASDIGNDIEDTASDVGNEIEDKCEEVKEGMDAKDSDC